MRSRLLQRTALLSVPATRLEVLPEVAGETGQLGIFEAWRGASPHATQLRLEPSASRADHIFSDVLVRDGDLVYLDRIDDTGDFAHVRCNGGDGWLQLSYLRGRDGALEAASALLIAERLEALSPLKDIKVWRASEPHLTQLRIFPSESREAHVFHPTLALGDGEFVRVLEVDATGLFALVHCDRGEGWIQFRHLRSKGWQTWSAEEMKTMLESRSFAQQWKPRKWKRSSVYDCLEVDVRDASNLTPAGFQELFDGRVPLVLRGAATRLAGSSLDFLYRLDVMSKTQPRAEGAAAGLPRLVRYTPAEARSPILMTTFGDASGSTYVVPSVNVSGIEGMARYLRLPSQCAPNIIESLIPDHLLPRSRLTVSIEGDGAGHALRRDPIGCCHALQLLTGRQHIAFLPPSTTPESLGAHDGDLGCAVATLDLFSQDGFSAKVPAKPWYADISPGDVVFVPPGWWHQTLSSEGPAMVVSGAYLTEASAPYALRSLRAWQCDAYAELQTQPLSDEIATASASGALKEAYIALSAGRPAEAPLGVGGWPFFCDRFPAQEKEGQEGLDFGKLLWERVDENPVFCFAGVALPLDAPRWRPAELQRFLASGGFLAPRLRFPAHTPSGRLAAWLREPVVQDAAYGWKPSGDTPRVIWMYWAQGAANLSGFRRLCIHSWRLQNPGWRIVLLDKAAVFDYVDAAELPGGFDDLEPGPQADALRLALIARYGGVWADVATLCLRPLDDWVWKAVAEGPSPRGMGAFYLACFGMEPGVTREYVENWFLAARRAHPFMVAWRDLYIEGWRYASTRFDYPESHLFRDVDLSHITIAEHRTWLTMHVCFKKMIDDSPEMRRIWSEEMLLLRADDGAMEWMGGVDAEKPEESARVWVFSKDDAFVEGVIRKAPMLKFVGSAAQALQWQPDEHLVARDNNIAGVLAHALPRPPGTG